MARFDADLATALPSATLLQQVVSIRATVPQAYLFCADTPFGPQVYCAYFPSKYLSALDGSESPWMTKALPF
jgi:hypothetical protein